MTTPLIALVLIALFWAGAMFLSEDNSDRRFYSALFSLPAIVWLIASVSL